MKLGLGLYKHQLDEVNLRFARQAGATHIVAHLVDYFRQAPGGSPSDQPTGGQEGWGLAGDPQKIWTTEELAALRQRVEGQGLELAAIENLDPAHWYDVLLDGPQKNAQVKGIQTMLRRMGEVGIPILGYNFSLAGVCGRIRGQFARGGAESVGMNYEPKQPIPLGMVWNMIYDPQAASGTLPPISREELWSRLDWFLDQVLPTAKEAGVTLALHPDDPPLPTMRGTPRLVFQPDHYQRLIDRHPSRHSGLEFCLGSIAEMTEGDVYCATEKYVAQGRIAYIHARNIRGQVPKYREVFIDEGDIDFRRIIRLLKQHDFEGVLIPDHTPLLTCDAPWHAGMAYALGYLKATMQAVNEKS